MQYRIIDEFVPVVEILFESTNEEMITQSGGMAWMTEGIEMKTDTNGGFFKGLGRMFAGESFFIAHYVAQKPQSSISFAANFPGKILPVNISEYPNGLICQKGAFLASELSVNLDVKFTKKFSSGIFGGEGFILQHIFGSGMVFLEIDGGMMEKNLEPGEVLKIDTGNVVAFEDGMPYEIEVLKGFKNIFFGGEGLFLTKLTGPGKVILQTQNINELVGRLSTLLPTSN